MTTAQEIQLATDTLDKVVIPLVGLAVAWAITHWGLKQKAENTLARQDLVGAAARTAVGAVEQQMAGADGADKRRRAIDTATTILAAHGITITDAEKQAIEAAIEAQVGAMKRAAAPAVTATPGPEAGVVVQPAAEAAARNHPNIPIAEEPS